MAMALMSAAAAFAAAANVAAANVAHVAAFALGIPAEGPIRQRNRARKGAGQGGGPGPKGPGPFCVGYLAGLRSSASSLSNKAMRT